MNPNILDKNSIFVPFIFSKMMKNILFLFIAFSTVVSAQDTKPSTSRSKKGSFYAYWGWNRDMYTKSDISFKGNDYDFTLHKIIALDHQSPWDAKVYLNPGALTIPQYNARVGYFLTDKYQISVGVDHMKYVMANDKMSSISGHIANSGTKYDGVYDNTPIQLTSDFLLFEHTDGLNYLNSEIRRSDKLMERRKFTVNSTFGAGGGILMPRTNCTLLGNPRYDQFHLAGFGIGAVAGINIEFWERFFLQTELKAGFIDMPSIRTTMFKADMAKQHFSFLQSNIVLGVILNNGKKKKK